MALKRAFVAMNLQWSGRQFRDCKIPSFPNGILAFLKIGNRVQKTFVYKAQTGWNSVKKHMRQAFGLGIQMIPERDSHFPKH